MNKLPTAVGCGSVETPSASVHGVLCSVPRDSEMLLPVIAVFSDCPCPVNQLINQCIRNQFILRCNFSHLVGQGVIGKHIECLEVCFCLLIDGEGS